MQSRPGANPIGHPERASWAGWAMLTSSRMASAQGAWKRHQLQFISKKSKGMCRQGVQFHWYRLWRVQTVCQTRVSESCADSC